MVYTRIGEGSTLKQAASTFTQFKRHMSCRSLPWYCCHSQGRYGALCVSWQGAAVEYLELPQERVLRKRARYGEQIPGFTFLFLEFLSGHG
jgi:hypothetical protein